MRTQKQFDRFFDWCMKNAKDGEQQIHLQNCYLDIEGHKEVVAIVERYQTEEAEKMTLDPREFAPPNGEWVSTAAEIAANTAERQPYPIEAAQALKKRIEEIKHFINLIIADLSSVLRPPLPDEPSEGEEDREQRSDLMEELFDVAEELGRLRFSVVALRNRIDL